LVLPEKQEPDFADKVAPPPGTTWPEDAAVWRMRRTLPWAWIVYNVEALAPLAHPLRIEAVDERTKAVFFPDNKAREFRHSSVLETNEPLAAWANQHVSGES